MCVRVCLCSCCTACMCECVCVGQQRPQSISMETPLFSFRRKEGVNGIERVTSKEGERSREGMKTDEIKRERVQEIEDKGDIARREERVSKREKTGGIGVIQHD